MPDFLIRHYKPEADLPTLARMLTKTEAIDRDGEDTSEENLRALLEQPNYRPDQDAWVAESDGKLVGYGVALEQPSQRCTLYVVVHPDQRRKGLGSQLLKFVIARAREFDSNNILAYTNERNTGSMQFLQHHQLQRVGSSGVMKAPAKNEIQPFKFPAGFSLKLYSEINEPRTLLKALNVCYLDMWGHQHKDNPSEEELKSPSFLKYYDADDILLLFDDRKSIAAIVSVKSEARKDETDNFVDIIDAPGVIKEYRDQEFQHQLILAAKQHLHQKGTRPHILEFWGESENALRMYRELGFEMVNHYLAYHKELK